MSLRLALDGRSLIDPVTGQPVHPFISKTGKVIFPILGAAPEDDTDDDDDDDEPDESSGSGSEATDKDGKDKDAPDKQRLSKEAASYRRKLRASEQELAALKTEREEREAAERTDLENATKQVEKLEAERNALQTQVSDLQINNAFLTDNTYTWHNPQRALKLADLSEVEISEDGTVSGLKEALEALAKSDSYLVKQDDDDDKGDAPDEDTPPTAGVTGKGKRGKDEATRQQLLNKYPSLQRR